VKFKRFDVIKFLFIASVLLPGIPLPGLFRVRIEEILAFLLLPAILSKPGKRLTWVDLGFILVGVSTFISIMWGTLVLGISISPRDMLEFVKIIKAWALFRLALHPWRDKELVSMAKTLLVCISVSAIIGIIEWQDWLGLRAVLQSIYATGTGNAGTRRVIGTVGNPNYYGLLMALGLALAVNMWNHNHYRVWRRLAVMGVGLCGVTLFLTNSRSSVLAAALAVCLSLLIRVPQLRYRAAWRALIRVRWQALVIAILAVGTAVWFWNQFQIIDTLTTPAEIRSYWRNPIHRTLYRLSEVNRGFDLRTEMFWKPNLSLIAKSPVLGWGVAKAEHDTVTDNGYLLTLRRYGLIGMLCFLLLYGQVSRVLFKGVCANRGDSICGRLALTALTIIVGYSGANLFVEVFYYLQLMSWLWLLVGITTSPVFYCCRQPSLSPANKKISRSAMGRVS
jgi:hypothetical protein